MIFFKTQVIYINNIVSLLNLYLSKLSATLLGIIQTGNLIDGFGKSAFLLTVLILSPCIVQLLLRSIACVGQRVKWWPHMVPSKVLAGWEKARLQFS